MIVAIYQNEEWLILDNLTNVLVRDSDKSDYEPLAVLDYKGARRQTAWPHRTTVAARTSPTR
jgi:hypothetical protein